MKCLCKAKGSISTDKTSVQLREQNERNSFTLMDQLISLCGLNSKIKAKHIEDDYKEGVVRSE